MDHAVSEYTARQLTYQRAGGRCELCGAPATDYSHRKARSQQGAWSPSNALHLCHQCHAYCHAHPEEAREQGWFVPSHTDPATVPAHLSTWLGVGWYRLLEWGGYDVVELEKTPYEQGQQSGVARRS